MSQLVDVSMEGEDDVAEVVDLCAEAEAEAEAVGSGPPPRRFQEYRRGAELGRGASGAVYACRRDYCSGEFAVKAVDLRRMHLSANPERQHTLLCREVEILRTLPPHRNIVRMVDAFEEGNWFLMVLERVTGGDLFTVLTARPSQRFLDAEAAYVTRQIAEGLAFLHGQRIIHRDLKLENVLVASERREQPLVFYDVKITDFGLSKDVSLGLSNAHSLVGTRPYTAPEVELKNSYGATSDLWCLGILVFIMLTGRFPFDRIPSQQSGLHRIVEEMQCGKAMKSVVSGLLQLDPLRRLSVERICSEDWLGDGLESLCVERPPKRQCTAAQSMSAAQPAPDQPASACTQVASRELSTTERMAGKVAQHYIKMEEHQRKQTLAQLLDALDFEQSIVFVNSAKQAVALEGLLASDGFSSISIHADLDPAGREQRRQRFMDFETRVLVSMDLEDCSCTAAHRVNLVINFDAPITPDQFLRRMGRGRRFLKNGCMITFVTKNSDAAVLEEVQDRLQVDFTAMLAEVKLDSDPNL